MEVSVNTQNSYAINFPRVNSGALTLGYASHKTGAINNSTDKIAISISYNNGGNPAAKAYLDYIEVLGKKQLVAGEYLQLLSSRKCLRYFSGLGRF